MPNISIKDVPEAWAESLRQRAARNHRSLQGELMAIVQQAVIGAEPVATGTMEAAAPAAGPRGPRIVGFDRFGHPIVQQGWKSIEQIAAELRMKHPKPVTGVPLGVDIIREERDAR